MPPAGLWRAFVWGAFLAALGPGFLAGALLSAALGLGVPLGPWWPAVAQVHGHAQLAGFAGLMVLGVAFHFLPRLRGAPLAAPGARPLGAGPLRRGPPAARPGPDGRPPRPSGRPGWHRRCACCSSSPAR